MLAPRLPNFCFVNPVMKYLFKYAVHDWGIYKTRSSRMRLTSSSDMRVKWMMGLKTGRCIGTACAASMSPGKPQPESAS